MAQIALRVREAGPADAGTIVRFNAEMARETEEIELPLDRLHAGVDSVFAEPSRGRYWICERDGRPVGQLMVTYEWSDWRNGNFWWIQSVYTEPASRKQGVYRALHEFVLNAARASGACGVRLYVERKNTRARGVYARLGLAEAPYEMMEVDFVIPRDH
jgi:GNAT superfamily N-acetyltransferase